MPVQTEFSRETYGKIFVDYRIKKKVFLIMYNSASIACFCSLSDFPPEPLSTIFSSVLRKANSDSENSWEFVVGRPWSSPPPPSVPSPLGASRSYVMIENESFLMS